MKNQKIIPHLWFNDEAEEAAEFYTSLFEGAGTGLKLPYGEAGKEIHKKEPGSVMSVEFELAGLTMVALNGGPLFSLTPAISLYVTCPDTTEVDALWQAFSREGEVLMPLGEYAWSKKYGWVKDKFGLTWQIAQGDIADAGRKIVPLLMYVSETGKAEEAINLYTSLFEDSEIVGILKYGVGEDQPEGTVKHAQFKLDGETFMAMDTHPKFANFGFTEAFSLLINCDKQEEIDHFWENLRKGGDPEAQVCGWLKDKYGLSWQVAPSVLNEMLKNPDADKVARVTNSFMKMKKLNISEITKAYHGE